MLSRGGLIGASGASGGVVTPTYLATHADLFSTSNVTDLTSDSWTTSGSNRFMLAGIASSAGTPVDPSGVKWGGAGGIALTKQGGTIDIGGYGKLSLYTLLAPEISTDTSYYSWPSAQDETVGGMILISGVNQSTPLGTVASATGSGDTDMTPSVSVDTDVGDLVVAMCWMVDTSGQSLTITQDGGNLAYDVPIPTYDYFIIQYKTATTTTTTMDFSISGTANAEVRWGVIGVPVKPI